jgi:hypothetical protein
VLEYLKRAHEIKYGEFLPPLDTFFGVSLKYPPYLKRAERAELAICAILIPWFELHSYPSQ